MQIKLSARQYSILQLLINDEEWKSSLWLSEQIEVSDRTIRTDINYIRSQLSQQQIKIDSQRSKGFHVDAENKALITHLFACNRIIVEDHKSSTYLTLLYRLLNLAEPIDIEDICEDFYYSRTAIEESLRKIANLLRAANPHLLLQREAGQIWITGNEKQKRAMINYIIMKSVDHVIYMDLHKYAAFFDYNEMVNIKEIILKHIKDTTILISDTGIIAIIIHTMIAIERDRKRYDLTSGIQGKLNEPNKQLEEYQAAQQISNAIKQVLKVQLNPFEIDSLAYQIAFRRFFPTEGVREQDIINEQNQYILKAVYQALYEIKSIFFLDITKDVELRVGLVYHLQALINRRTMEINGYKNPILSEIKDKYPFVFELAFYMRENISASLHINLDENEIGYIAIHLGAAFERFRIDEQDQPIKLAVVSHLDFPNTSLLMSKLRSLYAKKVDILGPYSVFDLHVLQKELPNIIISTTELTITEFSNAAILKISAVVTNQEKERLNELIATISSRLLNFKKITNDYFDKRFFYQSMDFASLQQVIAYMSQQLVQEGIVNQSFVRSVMEREAFSSTVMKNMIAIPHAAAFNSYQTIISVMKLKTPIHWGERKVKLVFLLAIKDGDQPYISQLFEKIADLTEDGAYVDLLMKSKSYKEFIYLMNNY